MSNRTAQPRTLEHRHRRSGVTLVQVGDCYALVDGQRERLWVLNASGASIWTRLGTEVQPIRQCQGFLAHLEREGLLQDQPSPEAPTLVNDQSEETPAILSAVPLQVAAGNSTDPFAGSGW